MQNNNQIAIKEKITDLAKPNEALDLANLLADIIIKRRLAMVIQKKRYVMVEGWQLAGALCGIYPIVEKVEDQSDENKVCYRAEVSLKDQDGNTVGSGMAICTNKEKGKTAFGDYAVFSMAQTRAVGKAFRLKLGWIMKLAGFEATPCEEMGEDGAIENVPEGKIVDETDYTAELDKAANRQELYKIWIHMPSDKRSEYKEYMEELKNKFEK